MTRLPIPDGPDALTPEWLTEALRHAGVLGPAAVASFEVERATSTSGLLSRLSRIRLTYDRRDSGAPATLIVKFHVAEVELRAFVCEANLTEERFYAEVAPHSELRTPEAYYSAIDTRSGECVLVLEDLARHRIVDDLHGCPPDDAATAVRHLAAFHARWWSDPRLDRMEWLKPFDRSFSVEIVGKPAADFDGPLPASIRDAARRIKRDYQHLFEVQSRPPRTVSLNDVKARHMFFGAEDQADDFAVVDFQLAVQGRGALDLSRFFGSSLAPDIRRANEMDLLHTYHDVLTAHGVEGYSFEALFTDYRFGHLQNLVDLMAVEAQGLQERGGPRLVRIQQEQLRRYTAAIVELDCAELLPP